MKQESIFDLSGKKALVTGSTEGIGLAIAKTLAIHGSEVVVHGRSSKEKCQEVCAALDKLSGTKSSYVLFDIEEPKGVESLINEINDIDILVINASIQIRSETLEISRKDFDSQVNANLWTTLRLIQVFLPYMLRQKWGRILMVGSVQEVKPSPKMAIYAALKSATANMVANLALQYGKDGVTVNNLAPGVITTGRNEEVLTNEKYAESIRQQIPVGFFGQPDDCAGIALLLCAEAGRYITGQTIYCDGGMSVQ